MIETGVYRLPDRHSKYLGPENGNPVPGFFFGRCWRSTRRPPVARKAQHPL